METRKLGHSDLNLSVVGLGTWAMGGGNWKFGWGEQDDQQSIKAITRAFELGINWIDTAPVYGFGHSEKVVGKAIKAIGTRPVVATKCSRTWDDAGNIIPNLTAANIRREVEASLTRLQIDCIDLYQVHWPEPDSGIEEAWETVAALAEEGKIKYVGVSNFSSGQIERIRNIHPVTSLQPPYSMLNRGVEEGLLQYCREHGIGIVCYSPMQKGVLTDKFNRNFVSRLSPDDHRVRVDPNFKEPQLSANLELVDLLRGIADKRGCSVAQLSIAWVLRREEVTSAIVGTRKPSQIEETANAWQCELSESDLAVIDMFLQRKGLV